MTEINDWEVGFSVTHPSGSVITILDIYPLYSSTHKRDIMVSLHCSKCSLDTELWGGGIVGLVQKVSMVITTHVNLKKTTFI